MRHNDIKLKDVEEDTTFIIPQAEGLRLMYEPRRRFPVSLQ